MSIGSLSHPPRLPKDYKPVHFAPRCFLQRLARRAGEVSAARARGRALLSTRLGAGYVRIEIGEHDFSLGKLAELQSAHAVSLVSHFLWGPKDARGHQIWDPHGTKDIAWPLTYHFLERSYAIEGVPSCCQHCGRALFCQDEIDMHNHSHRMKVAFADS